MHDNAFVGSIPNTWIALQPSTINLSDNSLTRTLAHRPIMNQEVDARRSSLPVRKNLGQDDTTPPLLNEPSQSFSRLQTGVFTYAIDLFEESYVLDVYNE